MSGGAVWVPSSHSLTPFPLQAPAASDQALVSATSEQQEMLEAAEALLTLKQSAQAPSGSISSFQLCVASGSGVLEGRTQVGASWETGGP